MKNNYIGIVTLFFKKKIMNGIIQKPTEDSVKKPQVVHCLKRSASMKYALGIVSTRH